MENMHVSAKDENGSCYLLPKLEVITIIIEVQFYGWHATYENGLRGPAGSCNVF